MLASIQSDQILDILKYVLPSLVVFACAYMMFKQFLEREANKERMDLLAQTAKVTLPVRMAAYERLVLFLERIVPQSVIARVVQSNMMSIELQRDLLITIRAEFEHNFSQQLYVSDQAWKAVRDTKELIIQLINQSAQSVAADAKASELGKRIIDNYASIEQSPIDSAIALLKAELASVC